MKVGSQSYGITKWKKVNGLCYGLFLQNLSDCGWLLEIDIFSVMVYRELVCWMRLVD